MLLGIYSGMLKRLAESKEVELPDCLQYAFYIDEKSGYKFWNSARYREEQDRLLKEWDMKEVGVYERKLGGLTFVIIFKGL